MTNLRRRRHGSVGTGLPPSPLPRLDARLLLGSAPFGVGSGIAGDCPGAAPANLLHAGEASVFVAGSQLARALLR